jgi:type IV pilus assembly protein PilF
MKVNPIRPIVLALLLLAGSSPSGAGDTSSVEADMAHNSGRSFLEQGRPDLAAEQFQRAINLDSKNYFAHKGLGIALAQMQKYKESEKVLRKCLDLNEDFADVHNDLGATLMLMGRRDEARKEWLLAFSSPFNPTPDQTAWNLANSFTNDGNHAEALRWYESVLQRNPKSVPGYIGMASALVALNHIDEAIARLQTAAKEIPDSPALMAALGDAYFRAGRFAEARAQLEAAIKKDPSGAAGKRAAEQLKHFPTK